MFGTLGFDISAQALPPEEVVGLSSSLRRTGEFDYAAQGSAPALPLLATRDINRLANSRILLRLAQSALGAVPKPYQAVMLDKNRDANWKLDWHQDSRIPVRTRINTSGYGDWSLEAGIDHVVPPRKILERCIALRVHLDDCDRTNGALEVIPGSHLSGLLGQEQLREAARWQTSRYCEIACGGIMAMSPLLVHRSPRSHSQRPRRVLQINYQSSALENGLQWWG
jgi:hypothetical protein